MFESLSSSFIQTIISQVSLVTMDLKKIISQEWTRPSVLFRPTLKKEVGEWQAIYGVEIIGTGSSPDAAMKDFDENWEQFSEEKYEHPSDSYFKKY